MVPANVSTGVPLATPQKLAGFEEAVPAARGVTVSVTVDVLVQVPSEPVTVYVVVAVGVKVMSEPLTVAVAVGVTK